MKKILMALVSIAAVFLLVSNATAVTNVGKKVANIRPLQIDISSIKINNSPFDHFILVAIFQFIMDILTWAIEKKLGRVSIIMRLLRLIPCGSLLDNILTKYCPSWVALKDFINELKDNPQ